jgi:hypothetical protein
MIGRAVLWRKKLFSVDDKDSRIRPKSLKKKKIEDYYKHSDDDYESSGPEPTSSRDIQTDVDHTVDKTSQALNDQICSSFTHAANSQRDDKFSEDKFPHDNFPDNKFLDDKFPNVKKKQQLAKAHTMSRNSRSKLEPLKGRRRSVSPRTSIVISNDIVINSIVTTTSPSGTQNTYKHSTIVNSSPKKTNSIKETKVVIAEPEDVPDSDNESIEHEITAGKNFYQEELIVDKSLAEGTPLLKVSATKKLQRIFRIDVDQGRILWDSKKSGKGKQANNRQIPP